MIYDVEIVVKHSGQLRLLNCKSYKLLLSPMLLQTALSGIMEKHCSDDVLKVECQKEQELLEEAEAKFMTTN